MTRSLHVGAMPFPSPQGTQAAVRTMTEALAHTDREVHLLTYGFGAESGRPTSVRWHRLGDFPRVRSLRSGPSLGKLALDVRMVGALRRLHRRIAPDVVVAHHVEACAAAILAGARPLIFVAHTALEPELGLYLGERWRRPARRAGRVVDRSLARRADALAAVCPDLGDWFAHRTGVPPHPWTVPWTVPPAIEPAERLRARARLGLEIRDEVALYAGNLDAYQGWETMVEAFADVSRRRPRARLLLATASDPGPLRAAARAKGVAERVARVPLEGENARRMAHAAADLAVVPRRTPGGLPIKLLDALARGLPTVATRRATAGLPVGTVLDVADGDDPHALSRAWERVLDGGEVGAGGEARRRAYVAQEHAPERFVAQFDATVGTLVP